MKLPWSVRVGLWLVAVASRLVPRHARRDWRLEWEGEVLGRWEELVGRGTPGIGSRLDLMFRSAGSFVDAMRFGHGRGMMKGFMDDLVGSARGLLRHPVFCLVVVSTLAVGVGASTAIFGVARDVLLRPFPYPDAADVVAFEGFSVGREGPSGNVTYPNLADLAATTSSFEGIGLLRWWVPALEDDRGALIVRGATVTSNLFSILGVEPGRGRFFRPDEQGEGREDVVVLSYPFWMDRFGGDEAIVGRDIRLSGVPHRVIGVTAADFEDPWVMGGPGAEPQLWRTVASPPSEWPRSGRSWRGIARVRHDVGITAAQAELDGAFARLVEAYPEANANRVMRITPLREVIAGPSRSVLVILLGSVGVLLLIACANLANLMLGRALDREGEFAVHRALGASGWRIMRRALMESAILALCGGALGLILAAWAGGAARGLGSLLPRPVTGAVDPAVAAFALAVTAGCGVLFGLAPAFQALRAGSMTGEGARRRGATAGREGQRLRRVLVIGQIAMTATLLVGSGLLARSFQRLGAVDLGLRTEGVAGVELHGASWWELTPEAAEAQWHDVLAAVRAQPGIEAVGAIDYLPLGGNYSCDGVYRPDLPVPGPGEGRCAEVRVVLPGAMEALGIELVRGRRIERSDGIDAPRVTLIDESLAQALWPGEDPLDKEIQVHTQTHRVVGVVRDMRHFGPGEVGQPMLYLSAPQEGWNGIARGLALVVAWSGSSVDASIVRDAVHGVNAGIALGAFQPLDALLRASVAVPRFRTALMVAFGSTALLLALLGIAGVMMYSVARRTRELGVRLALGARPEEVRGLVMREGGGLVAWGLTLGVAGALAGARALESMLFEVSSHDPFVYLGMITFLAAASAAACYLPARRASRVSPIAALASE